MQFRTLGNTGLLVSAVSLGTMQFGQSANVGQLDQQATTSMVRYALDRGINLIDTADVYSTGESETLVGNALKGIRHEVVLATKVRLPMSDNLIRAGTTRVNIMLGIESSLRRLQTDYVDLYQVHSWDSTTPLEETLRALDDLVHQGKVRYVGLSNYMAWQAALALGMQKQLGLAPYVTAQMYYSLVGRDLEDEFISFAQYTNMGILVWSPLAGGFLSGKYHRNSPPPQGSRFADSGRFVPFDLERGYQIIDVLHEVASHYDATLVRVAIAWLLAQPAISSVIVAGRTNEHLEENIRAIDLKLTDEDMNALNAVSDPGVPYPRWMVYQHDYAEDPRARTLDPNISVKDLRGQKW